MNAKKVLRRSSILLSVVLSIRFAAAAPDPATPGVTPSLLARMIAEGA